MNIESLLGKCRRSRVVRTDGNPGGWISGSCTTTPTAFSKVLKASYHLRKNTSCLSFQMTDLEKQNKPRDYCTRSIFYMLISSVLSSLFGISFGIRG